MSPTSPSLSATPAFGRPRITPAPVVEWLQVPRLLLTLATLRLQRAWQRNPGALQRSRRQLIADWEV